MLQNYDHPIPPPQPSPSGGGCMKNKKTPGSHKSASGVMI
ncbi:hypothetical protein MICA_2443 [Micavibrio aeruginosavorus ARL-13]|uniref:Uncharacterized protein n=1 Tax=Micavibrio aeruginosavorus (strain ARL-13) TaxID=856793 RepID=G2KNV0_MICAA|nr:hypothetical protein MICA_2443 [Micavibrio aeruginosavorus ARL-13]